MRLFVHNKRAAQWAGIVLLLIVVAGCSSRYSGPKSPQGTVESFEISDEFRVEVFAAEPDLVDPVAIAFDANGRIYAAEMLDYPFRPEDDKARSRVRLLEDTDADGKVDESTVFADSLMEVTSIQPWKGGVLVTAAPEILYLKDTDGDKKADVQKVVFTGFYTGNSEAQITNLRFNIDNWIYGSNTGRAGNIKYVEKPDADAVSVKGGDFRFRLDRDRYEGISGYAQFGQDVDDFGHRFVTQNTLHVRHVVVPNSYMKRNPYLSGAPRTNINDHGLRMYQQTPTPYWRAERTKRRNKRYDEKDLDRTEYARDHFTGCSGGTYYSAAAFPKEYQKCLFTGEVSGNLIHRDVIRPKGATFTANRAPNEQDQEFLTSTDSWFRPASLAAGPDGMLYVVDFYRQHIESPYSIPEDLKADMDFYAGEDMGRIYRIVPKDAPSSYEQPRLGKASSKELVEVLGHENRWWRLTAQRLLLERQDRSVTPLLKQMVQNHQMPQARLHALYTLEGLDALESSLLKSVLLDPHPGVREQAVRLAERHKDLADELAKMVDDPSARVAFQVGLSLGAFSNPKAEKALAELVQRRGDDYWVQTAVLTSPVGSSVDLLERLAATGYFEVPSSGRAQFLERAAEVIGARGQREEVEALLALLVETDELNREVWRENSLNGLAEGLGQKEEPMLALQNRSTLQELMNSRSDNIQAAAKAVAKQVKL